MLLIPSRDPALAIQELAVPAGFAVLLEFARRHL